MSDLAAQPQPKRAKLSRSRRRRLLAKQAKAGRNVKLFNLLKAGMSTAEIAFQEGLSIRRVREIVQEMLRRREIDPSSGFVELQIGRLSDAMMVAHTAMMEGDMHALDRVLRIVSQLDRYHGFAGAPAQTAAGTPALAAPASALALPAPDKTAPFFPAED